MNGNLHSARRAGQLAEDHGLRKIHRSRAAGVEEIQGIGVRIEDDMVVTEDGVSG